MKKLILAIAIVIIMLANTVPSKQDYVSWMNNKIIQQTASTDNKLMSFIGGTLINSLTTEENLYFCSVFRTYINDTTITTLGVFNKFVVVGKENERTEKTP